MKIIRLIVEVEGGVVQSIYGDAMPEGVELDLVVRDLDNIDQGDPDPLTEQDMKDKYKRKMTFYW